VLAVGPLLQFWTSHEDELVVRGEVSGGLGEPVQPDHDRYVGSMVEACRSVGLLYVQLASRALTSGKRKVHIRRVEDGQIVAAGGEGDSEGADSAMGVRGARATGSTGGSPAGPGNVSGAGSGSGGYFAAQPSSSRMYAWRRGGRSSERPLPQFFTVCVPRPSEIGCRREGETKFVVLPRGWCWAVYGMDCSVQMHLPSEV
jgi:hypothetical protein